MPPRDLPPRREPWIETAAGGLFFVNVLLVTPAVVVLLPLALEALLRTVGNLEGPSPRLDVVPLVAAMAAPWLGWVAAPAAWFAWRSRSRMDRRGPRAWLVAFTLLHLLVVGYTVWRWTGGGLP